MATVAGFLLVVGVLLLLVMAVGFVLSVLTGRIFRRVWLFVWGEDATVKSPKDVS